MNAIDLNRLRDNLLILLVGFYLVLNYGFMLLRPAGIPLGELLLVFALLTINHRTVLPKFLASPLMMPFSVWLVVGFSHMVAGMFYYGLWAIRDASHVIESLYLYVGFAFAGNRRSLERLGRWMPYIFLAVVLYILTYPYRDTLIPFSPLVTNVSGVQMPVFFSYTNTAMALVIVGAYYLQRHFLEGRHTFLHIAVFVITLALLLLPSRTLYLQLFLLFLYFSFAVGIRGVRKIAMIAVFPILLIALILGSGITVAGRFGEDFGLTGYATLFLEIFGLGSKEETFSSGNAIRLQWWGQILEDWRRSWGTIFFGKGFGFPLVDFFIAGGVQVREPHNDMIGILARMGLVSLSAFLFCQAWLVMMGIRVTCFYRREPRLAAMAMALLFLMLCTLIMMLGESPFVMSFFAIPHYFAAGVILRLDQLRRKAIHLRGNPDAFRSSQPSTSPIPA